MKRSNILRSVNAVIFFVVLLGLNIVFTNAQLINKKIIEVRQTPTRSGTNRKTSVKAVRTVFVPQVKVVREKTFVNPTTLIVTVLPDAEVSLESISSGKKINLKKKAGENQVVTFPNLRPGEYNLSVSLEGYIPQVGPIPIKPQQISTVPVDLRKMTYEFPIQTNIKEGELRYAPVEVKERSSSGTLKVQETGGYCVVEIENQRATIKELAEGYYNIDVSDPNSPEYQPEKLVIQIPQDIPQETVNEPGEKTPFKVDLKNTQSTLTFNSLYGKDWKLPEKWDVREKGGIRANGPGIALPKDVTYRYYKDFELQSTVRLLNNTSIGFVVRAVDENNYYLIQFTGSEAKEKYLITGTIVKNGIQTQTVLTPSIKHIPNLTNTFSNQEYFSIIIKAREKKFQILYEDNKTGKRYELGDAVFQDNNYPIGAVGVYAAEKSSFEVGIFTVCNEICK